MTVGKQGAMRMSVNILVTEDGGLGQDVPVLTGIRVVGLKKHFQAKRMGVLLVWQWSVRKRRLLV